MDTLLKTACHEWHAQNSGRMVDFAGWEMPIQYSTIIEEHHAVRKAVGLFDIAHMGRLRFTGTDACQFLDHLITNEVSSLQVGQIRYALITNEQGGILDDVLVYRFPEFYIMVVNASNRIKILDWIESQRANFDFQLEDLTQSYFMLALQGPKAIDLLNSITQNDISEIQYYWGTEDKVLDVDALVTRTGYTGEDGFEVMLPAEHGLKLWETLIEQGRAAGILPTGLACRDTLRLEAAMPLYGHELNESIDPYTAGLSFAVKPAAKDFIGKEAVVAAKENKSRKRRVGLELVGRRIAREGSRIFNGETQIGEVTSGTFSPTLEKSIAMGYIEPEFAKAETEIEVDIRGKRQKAQVVKLPFYKRG